jgi:hypothetical protein
LAKDDDCNECVAKKEEIMAAAVPDSGITTRICLIRGPRFPYNPRP